MSALQGVIFITFDINTKETEFIRNDNITDYDTNVTNVYVQSKYKNSNGETVYLSSSEIANYNFSLYAIKPLTNEVREITGAVTNELTEKVRGGVIKFVIPKTCTNRSGIVKCELHINKEKEMIASTRFILDVQQSLATKFNDSLLEDEDFPVLKQLILEIQKASNINDSAASSVTTYSGNKIENIKENLSSQIKEKMNIGDDISVNQINKNLGKLDQTYMTDEFLQQIAGNTPVNATPADGSITEIKLANKSLTPSKFSDETLNYMKGGIVAKNLVTIGNMEDGSEGNWFIKGGGTASASGNILTFTPETYNSNIAIVNRVIPSPSFESLYFLGLYVKGNSPENKILFTSLSGDMCEVKLLDTYANTTLYGLIGTVLPTDVGVTVKVINYSDSNEPIELSKLVVINLSEAYGYGNEPTDIEYIKRHILKYTNNNFYINSEDNTFIDFNPNFINNKSITYEKLSDDILNKLESKQNIKVKCSNNDFCEITFPYTNSTNLTLLFQRTGANNIFNFKEIFTSNKSTGEKTAILAQLGTDWFGPYVFNAKNNIDGDLPDQNAFTGGNHAYDGGGTGTPTGRTSYIKIYCDGELIKDSFEGNCNEVKIKFENLLQASNTKKDDGSGRECLKEEYILYCNKIGQIEVENKITALEDIDILTYYGLQHTNKNWTTTKYYCSDSNKAINAGNINSNSGDNGTCNRVISTGGKDTIEMYIDRNEGLGINKNIKPAIFCQNGKTYIHTINNMDLNQNEMLTLKGGYKFYYND